MALTPDATIAVIGLGYVGLPLALAFGQRFHTIGYDLQETHLALYREQIDPKGEVTAAEFQAADKLLYTDQPELLATADFVIVAVPTPIDTARRPDLLPLMQATETAGRYLKRGAVVIFESTVYPGVTEDVCVPILEKSSRLIWKKDFHVGYSPERINPGDREHTLSRVVKVVSGDDPATLVAVAELYGTIVAAGVYRADSIKEAEAAKVIENTQRDLNIALMNELAVIFDRLGIDTLKVLAAAGTKWNFLPFRPGLVGGHCIGVDPYYLTYKAQSVGLHPEVILAGRRINDSMGKYVAEKTIKLMLKDGLEIGGSRVGILGLTFKEDCPDLRNSKVVDIVRELEDYGVTVLVHDPRVEEAEAQEFFGITLCDWEDLVTLSGLILAVPHSEFRAKSLPEYLAKISPQGCLIDVKSTFDLVDLERSGVNFWRL